MANLNIKISLCLAYEVQIVILLIKKIIILAKYLNFANIVLKKLAAKLSKRSVIKKHLINLKLDM